VGQSYKKGLLWEISGNGLTKSSYMFGTHHSFPKEFIDSIYKFNMVFDSVDLVIAETNTIDETSIFLNKKITDSLVLMPEGIKYNNILNKKDLQLVDSFFMCHLKVKSDRVNIRPSVARSVIARMISKNYLQQGQLSLDEYIKNMAVNIGKEVYGLESTEVHLNVLYKKSNDLVNESKQLVLFINNINYFKNMVNQISSAYREQDLNKIETCFSSVELKSESMNPYENQLKNRNLKWIPKILEKIKHKPSLIVVGCGHFIGEFGLINQLLKLGYIVNPI
jgi:hypothetical protein